jgi:hypothetical protein
MEPEAKLLEPVSPGDKSASVLRKGGPTAAGSAAEMRVFFDTTPTARP